MSSTARVVDERLVLKISTLLRLSHDVKIDEHQIADFVKPMTCAHGRYMGSWENYTGFQMGKYLTDFIDRRDNLCPQDGELHSEKCESCSSEYVVIVRNKRHGESPTVSKNSRVFQVDRYLDFGECRAADLKEWNALTKHEVASAAANSSIASMPEANIIEACKENFDIIDVSKLAALPQWLQKSISTLTRTQLKTLGATISVHDRFELMRLPLEIRRAIYGLVWAPEDSCPIIDSNKRTAKYMEEQEERENHYYDCDCEHHILETVSKFDISLLLTSKMVYAEAIDTLYNTRAVKIFVKEYNTSQHLEYYDDTDHELGYKLDPDDELTFWKFRKVEIRVTCFEDFVDEYGRAKKETIGYMFCDLAGKIIAQFKSNASQPKKELHFEFVRWENESLDLEAEDPMDKNWAICLWTRLHLVELVKQMRAELDFALGKNVVVLTTNVEAEIPHIDAIRTSSTRIEFRHHKIGKKGVLSREENDRVFQFLAWGNLRMELKFEAYTIY
ncbi:hypothetical protein FKW77_002138 [Venturia effusa]|uniref:DUF7730 domain-containing protein n=1 Tax=Venturia effusa TaxID=50376 RepID=A0A517LF40_9PEZI|nr:hypothetical protein FKW77_002138 [Venturia effusa]